VVRFGSDQIFNFILFTVLARLLTPDQFGVYIAAYIFVEFGKVVANGGLPASLLRAPVVTPLLANTVFWANIGLGLMVAAVGYSCSGLMASALGSRDAGPILAALAFVIPITCAGASH